MLSTLKTILAVLALTLTMNVSAMNIFINDYILDEIMDAEMHRKHVATKVSTKDAKLVRNSGQTRVNQTNVMVVDNPSVDKKMYSKPVLISL